MPELGLKVGRKAPGPSVSLLQQGLPCLLPQPRTNSDFQAPSGDSDPQAGAGSMSLYFE